MFELAIETSKGTFVSNVACSEDMCVLGKSSECDTQLHGWRIGKQHAKINREDDGLHIEDLDTKYGTYVNGKVITRYGPLSSSDKVEIHGYIIYVNDNFISATPAISESYKKNTPSIPPSDLELASTASTLIDEEDNVSTPKSSGDGVDENMIFATLYQEWRGKVSLELIKQMDLRRINVNEMSDVEFRAVSEKTIKAIIETLTLPDAINKDLLCIQVLNEAVGLGPLEELLELDGVSEIMVNAADEIFYEKSGKLIKSSVTFTNDKAVLAAIERIVAPLGRRIDESSPSVDARLKDGSRVNAIIPPIALKGPCITIRRFMKEKLTAQHLVGFGSLSNEMVNFLENAVKYKQNFVISGGTGSGKTTLLNVLSNFIPQDERIITVEDAAELKLNQKNLVSLESRPANQEGKGAVAIRELVKNCLRMRPDRIVVGECRGGEALDMLQAMNTGHDGSLTTAHANNPRDCISRLEIMVMMAGMELPIIAVREQISSAINMIVQQTRFSCGTRKVTSITEVSGVEGDRIQLGEIFKFKQTGYDNDGKILGHFVATGLIPEFYESLSKRGINIDLNIFNAGSIL
jgi:pilus assembly protein CpaF